MLIQVDFYQGDRRSFGSPPSPINRHGYKMQPQGYQLRTLRTLSKGFLGSLGYFIHF